LNHWGQLGPVKTLAEKRQTFLLTRWRCHHGRRHRPIPFALFSPKD
jgi:hypothetical protein